MKIIQITFCLLAFIATFVSATINILFPSSKYYLVAGQTNEIMWTSEITDTLPFSIFLINANISDLKQFAVANNVDPRLGKKDVEIGANMNYTGFQLIFTDIGNINSIYATSETFEIKEAGTTPTAYSTPTPTPSPTASSAPSVTPKSSSNSIHNYGFGVLTLAALFAITLF
ncbi:unnamed protein product [Rhizophagus irregularis]|uniref:Yeast cell wall synthesis Kre9/Knh1-like N-terminal domain-containing protein n=1 Tax=Rhizophagus irregularis TaxID=588596 RepID=A0A2I1FYD5_9GLOM|nr:hypothetical protein RhiirA4_440001 [Rhizophagus irregularis]CAB4427594.1 unnamed protein product [Rhizophagus irregularis]